jgi:hypothetical protein
MDLSMSDTGSASTTVAPLSASGSAAIGDMHGSDDP